MSNNRFFWIRVFYAGSITQEPLATLEDAIKSAHEELKPKNKAIRIELIDPIDRKIIKYFSKNN